MEDINIGAITEALNDKTDRDMRNVDTVSGGDAVIAYQVPTAGNGYTWYRKYKSGWVEQGGLCNTGANKKVLINLPITMADGNYTIQVTMSWSETATAQNEGAADPTTTGFYVTSSYASVAGYWQVSGVAA